MDEKHPAMDLEYWRAGVDAGDLVVWVPTHRKVADWLTKHLATDEEIESICVLIKTCYLHARFTDAGDERTLTAAQREAEGHCASREVAAQPVPAELDFEDESSPRVRRSPSAAAIIAGRCCGCSKKHTSVGLQAEK